MYYAYTIQSIKTGKYYTGSGKDPLERLKRHNSGYTKSLKHKGPFKLVHQEIYETKTEAYRRERQIKSYKGGEAFKRLVKKVE